MGPCLIFFGIGVIDEARRNIVVSRRKLIEDQREELKKKLLGEIEPGQIRKGIVKNIAEFGAFVKLEPGVEGLVHISEMSWTRRINHPSELLSTGDQIQVQVLNINKEKQEISLGIKQVQPNPWDEVVSRYPPGTVITGVVRNLTNYGAFIEIEEGIDGLLHVSDMSWVRKVSHPSEVVAKGDQVKCVILNVDQERKRVALGLKQMASDPWEGDIPGRYKPSHGRSVAHFRTGRPQGREPRGSRQGWRRDRGQGAPRGRGRAQGRPEPEADRPARDRGGRSGCRGGRQGGASACQGVARRHRFGRGTAIRPACNGGAARTAGRN